MPRALRLWTAFLVVAALSTSAVFPLEARRGAATPRPKASHKDVSRVLPSFWNSLTRLLGEVGRDIDPYGGCGNAPAAKPTHPAVDSGCSIDPYGSCKP
jgi:hypothetical protein